MSYNFLASKNRLDRQVRYFFRLYCYRNCFHDWTLNCLFSQNNILYVINKHQNVNRKKTQLNCLRFVYAHSCRFNHCEHQSVPASNSNGSNFTETIKMRCVYAHVDGCVPKRQPKQTYHLIMTTSCSVSISNLSFQCVLWSFRMIQSTQS